MKEKQIEKKAIKEMAEVIDHVQRLAWNVVGASASPKMIATDLYNKGYRKQSEKYLVKENGDVVPLDGQSEIITLYDRIKAMPLDEMVSFFVYLESRGIITTADRYICQKCRSEHGGHCSIHDDDKCLYDASNKDTIKLWLEGAAYGEAKGGKK